jgi:hypothetical protein
MKFSDKNSLWNALSLKKMGLYVKKKKSQDMGAFVKTSYEGAKRFQSEMRMTQDRNRYSSVDKKFFYPLLRAD